MIDIEKLSLSSKRVLFQVSKLEANRLREELEGIEYVMRELAEAIEKETDSKEEVDYNDTTLYPAELGDNY